MGRPAIWTSIRDRLTTEITEGHYGAGDKLPTEAALSRRFGVNRHTVRRALGELAEAGLIYARRGAGVFVASRPTEYPIGRRVRFHQNLAAAGQTPEKRILRLETRGADAREAEALALEEGAQVQVYEGLSLADGLAIAVFRSVFPGVRFPRMLADLEETRSVTAALSRGGVEDYTRAWTRLTAVAASATDALHLRVREGAPILRSVAVNIDEGGVPVEYGRTWFAGERVTLTVTPD